jgi:hypothetical protein
MENSLYDEERIGKAEEKARIGEIAVSVVS